MVTVLRTYTHAIDIGGISCLPSIKMTARKSMSIR